MSSILILSTCYDSVSYYTSRWAARLRDDLVLRKDTVCLLHDATSLCRNGTGLSEAIACADFVVFFGHGTQDEWIAVPELPSAAQPVAAIAVVDSKTIDVLDERKAYGACCWSLKGLGKTYIGKYGNTEFIGYDQEFDFSFRNEKYFGDVVNQSIVNFVNGTPAKTVAQDLRTEWQNLKVDFKTGSLKNRPDAHAAWLAAERNSQRVGSLP
jgi:hypothetical protein